MTLMAMKQRAWLRFARKWGAMFEKPSAKWLTAHEAFKAGVRVGRQMERTARAAKEGR